MLVAAGAWLLHVAALALAPLSLVQAVISGGLVFLAVLAERVFGLKVGPRQWLGIRLTALGLVLLTATLPSTAGAEASYSVAAMVAFETGLLSVGTLLRLSRAAGGPSAAPRPLARHGSWRAVRGLGRRDQGAHRRPGRLGDPWFALALARALRARVGDRVLRVRARAAEGRRHSSHHPHQRLRQCLLDHRRPGRLRGRPERPVGIVFQGLALPLVIVAAALVPGPLRLATA